MAARAERQAEAARRRAQIVQARMAGATFEQIGRQHGITDSRAQQLYADAMHRTVKEPADQHRALELRRLDDLQLRLTQVLRRDHVTISGGKLVVDDAGLPYLDDGPVIAVALALLRVQESRRALLGLDAPTKVDATVSLRVAWEQASHEEKMDLLDADLVRLQEELAQLPDPTDEQLVEAPAASTDPEALARAVEAALDAAGVPEGRREAAYRAVEDQLQGPR
jgi:hypothetical protein